MLVVSYGMPKSASTYLYVLIKDILEGMGHDQGSLRRKYISPEAINSFYPINDENFLSLAESIDERDVFLIKTHSELTLKMRDFLAIQNVQAFASFRDPLDIIVSLYDVGERERRIPKDKQREYFASIHSYEDARQKLDRIVLTAESWLRASGVESFTYEFLTSEPYLVAEKINNVLKLRVEDYIDVKTEAIVDFYERDKKRIGEFNVGGSNRWADRLSGEMINEIVRSFKDFRQGCGFSDVA